MEALFFRVFEVLLREVTKLKAQKFFRSSVYLCVYKYVCFRRNEVRKKSGNR